jgi:hypothetical protein
MMIWLRVRTVNWLWTDGNLRTSHCKAGSLLPFALILIVVRDEHHNRSPDCAFFTLITEHQQKTNTPKKSAKSRKPRASKASRLSAQSTFTATSEAPSITDLPPEEDDSVLTTATSATVISQSGRKMMKGKKLTKGRKTKTKKEEVVEVRVDMKPEDADFEVKVEQPKTTRGKKRSSEQMYETSTLVDVQPPPAKRRGTRNTRGSVVALDDSLAPSFIEKYADEMVTSADDIIPDKAAPNRKRGRPSNAKSQRNVSSASTASKASLRMAGPDADEIDRALQADLERPLTDDEDEYLIGSKSRRESRLKKSRAATSTAPVRKATRGSKAQKDYSMFATGDISIDEDAIDAELQAMEIEEAIPLPKAKAAKGKQSRKPSAKQQAAAKRAADAAQAEVIESEGTIPESKDAEIGGQSSFPKSRKGQNTGSLATSHKVPGRATRASAISINESNISSTLGFEDGHDSGNDSDASMASHSTVVRGGAKRRGSSIKKTNNGKKTASRNIEEIINQSVDTTASQQDAEEAPQKKRAGRPKKIADADKPLIEKSQHTVARVLQEPLGEQPTVKSSKAKPAKSKGKGKALPDLPADPEVGPPKQGRRTTPESPKQAARELTPSLSPQSSDAENRPPSSKPSTIKQAGQVSQASRIPLAASTPTASPSKRNIIAGLQSSHPWTAVDLDEILLRSPSDARAEKENVMSGMLAEAVGKVKRGELTSPEKRMKVEEWIMYNASLAEDKLKGECERMVGVFEREGGRAMRVLEGVVCTE